MYVEQTSDGFNIIGIDTSLLLAIQHSIDTQAEIRADELTKEQKRSLRKLSQLIHVEIESL